ncbi:hypothetical protein NET02_15930 [Thermomicrobiaceae bacterium CFH 74404]|uniref:Uncharacterized protein n=1 Tax=Thermalbibacter longus TaxID=2951981 RepID=A0AA42BEC4_9BACT|nr:hypothetical protein [Thermalbibacter longus]MCM8750633.1 hypothetical protein [Thermalbibacter longus]
MGDTTLTPNQRRTLAARQAYRRKYAATPEQQREHYAELARRRAGRIDLTPEETAALVAVYDLLRPIAERARRKLAAAGSPSGEEGSGDA